VIISFSVTGCIIIKKDDPKILARESFDLYSEAMGAIFNLSKIAEIEKKTRELEERVDRLSKADKKRYEAELNRLSMEAMGSLFIGFGNMLKKLSESDYITNNNYNYNRDYSFEDTKEALETAGKLLDSTKNLLDSVLNFANSFND